MSEVFDLNSIKNEERQKCEIWTRVMGFHRPVSNFNIGKKSEFKERTYFTENKAYNSTYAILRVKLNKAA
jgi:hypothetical protein